MGRLTFLILSALTEQRFGKMDESGQQLGGSFQSELSQRVSNRHSLRQSWQNMAQGLFP